MKTFNAIATALTIFSLSATALAAPQTEDYMEVCRAQLQGYYGPRAEIDLIRRHPHGDAMRLKVAARVDADNAYFATCWITSDDVAGYEFSNQQPMLAALPESGASN